MMNTEQPEIRRTVACDFKPGNEIWYDGEVQTVVTVSRDLDGTVNIGIRDRLGNVEYLFPVESDLLNKVI